MESQMRRASAGILLLAFAALGGCKSAPAPLTDADRAAAQRMDSAYSAAVAAGDTAGMMANYAPDAMVMPSDMPMARGTDQIRQLWKGMTSVKESLQLTQETADGAGDFMYTSGRYHYQELPAETGASEDGKYLEVFRRGADGKWLIVAESWSPNAPRAPMAAPAAPAKKPARPAR
jgi:ketosteroid isomerase-like protein